MKFSLSDPGKHKATLAYSNVRYQSSADDQGSTATGQRVRFLAADENGYSRSVSHQRRQPVRHRSFNCADATGGNGRGEVGESTRWAAASALIPVRPVPARHARNEKGADIAVVARKLRCITMYFYIAKL